MKKSEIKVGKKYRNRGAGRTVREVIGIGDEFRPKTFFSTGEPPNEPGVEYRQSGDIDRLYISSFAKWAGGIVEDNEMKKRQNGFTLIELMIAVVVILMVGGAVFNSFANNRGATESRAKEGANMFIDENGLREFVSRMSCAGDSDGDGYGTCNLAMVSGEKIVLNCPTNYWDVNVWGAGGCKEVLQSLNINGNLVGQ
jgi:prepilin-type N-terminal cleavage/methylation domain-containing protein